MSKISTNEQNFIQIGSEVSFLRMCNFAPLGTKWFGCFLEGKGSSRKATAETWAQILTQNTSKDAVPRNEVLFWGSQNQRQRFRPPFSLNRHFGPHLPENGFNIGRLES